MPGGQSLRDQVNVRLSDEAITTLYALQDHLGISQSAIFEMLIREKGRTERANGMIVNPLKHSPRGTSRATNQAKAGTASSSHSRRPTEDRREK
jgi:hypothetical protein